MERKYIKYMTKKYIESFSAEYKTKVVLELLELKYHNYQRNIKLRQKIYKIGKTVFEQC